MARSRGELERWYEDFCAQYGQGKHALEVLLERTEGFPQEDRDTLIQIAQDLKHEGQAKMAGHQALVDYSEEMVTLLTRYKAKTANDLPERVQRRMNEKMMRIIAQHPAVVTYQPDGTVVVGGEERW